MGWVRKDTPITKRTGHYYLDKEIALHGLEGKPVKTDRHNTHWWPEKHKIEAATLWAVTRNIETVHKITTIPRWAIRRWMNEPWWDNVVNNVRKEQNELLDIKLTEVIGTAVEVISDRLKNGEIHVDRKTNEEFRIPANLKAASTALEVTFKERQLLRGEATARTESASESEKLKKLANQFEKLAASKLINSNSEVIEHEPIPETREESEIEASPETEDWREESSEDGASDRPRFQEEEVDLPVDENLRVTPWKE